MPNTPQTAPEEELKACPFCGSDGTLLQVNEGWNIGCVNSECVAAIDDTDHNPYTLRVFAISAWNSRPLLPEGGEGEKDAMNRAADAYLVSVGNVEKKDIIRHDFIQGAEWGLGHLPSPGEGVGEEAELALRIYEDFAKNVGIFAVNISKALHALGHPLPDTVKEAVGQCEMLVDLVVRHLPKKG